MKNVSTKFSKTDSPKTPGGISRSLLTPCRRLGLSRNIRKTGISPFQSPLPSNNDVKQEKAKTRKRKESLIENPETSLNVDDCITVPTVALAQTPTRNVVMPHRKKSKTLLASIQKCSEETEPLQEKNDIDDKNVKEKVCKGTDTNDVEIENKTEVSAPIRIKSKTRSKPYSPSCSIVLDNNSIDREKNNLSKVPTPIEIKDNIEPGKEQLEIKEKSPNNLTKECIVVIQKKIFKNELKDELRTPENEEKTQILTQKPKDVVSQALDLDSDHMPLICMSNKMIENVVTLPSNADDIDEFVSSIAVKKNNNKKSSKPKIKSPVLNKTKNTSKVVNTEIQNQPNLQCSVEDDDDFFEKKRTILIRKSYNKEVKPQKAKSTGSITQKDIDDIQSRIEMKKKLLLARAMTEDTKELRDLIKKWQKGCQDALMELMDLMKNKFSDKQNMDYSEMLQTLKIPASLVGYDSDNDCFVTPDDESIILANVKN